MSLLRVLTSAPSAALGLAIGLSGCIIDIDDGWVAWRALHECSVDVQTSGAYDGRITAVEGCTVGSTSFTPPDAGPDVERDIGVFPKDNVAFARLYVTLYVPLEDEGEGIEVTIHATRTDGVTWSTPAGACTANYVSKNCDDYDSYDGEPGRQYTIQDVHCSDAATAEGEPDLVIEDFKLTSSCEPEDRW